MIEKLHCPNDCHLPSLSQEVRLVDWMCLPRPRVLYEIHVAVLDRSGSFGRLGMSACGDNTRG